MSRQPSRARLAVVVGAATALAAGTMSTASSIEPASAGVSAAGTTGAVALLTEAAPQSIEGSRRGVVGDHLRVRLRQGALPDVAAGQRLSLPLGESTGIVTIAGVEHRGDRTAWTGALSGDRLSSFSLVRAGQTFRGSLISPSGVYSLTSAADGDYWWTEVAPRRGAQEGPDTLTSHDTAREPEPGAAHARAATRATITVLFAYTRAAMAEAGGKEQLKAAATLVVSQTNEAFANSGLKVTFRYRGLVKARGKESGNALKNLARLTKPRDGRFDNLHRARRKKGADLVHLFTTGSAEVSCGAGNLPLSVRGTSRRLAFSTSFYSCMPYLVATHEFGHNLGADHIGYQGVSHDSKIPYAYGFYNIAGNYISVMGYYDPCEDAQVFTCVRVPWFSSPTNTYNGQPLGVGEVTNNTKVIAKIAPKVARYMR